MFLEANSETFHWNSEIILLYIWKNENAAPTNKLTSELLNTSKTFQCEPFYAFQLGLFIKCMCREIYAELLVH